jgi:hypothetical protein
VSVKIHKTSEVITACSQPSPADLYYSFQFQGLLAQDSNLQRCTPAYAAGITVSSTPLRLVQLVGSPASVMVDTTGPTITINNPNTSPATSKTITASASDGTLTMSYIRNCLVYKFA